MPALPTTVTDFIDRICSDLDGSNGFTINGGYPRAQDLATVFELLQDGLDTGTLTAVSGTARSVVDGAATFTANQQIGNVVVFTGNTTAALAGVEARVVSNTTTTLFFADGVLPAAPASGDTYVIRGGLVDDIINELREGKGFAEAPAGNGLGMYRQVLDALLKFASALNVTLRFPQVSHPSLAAAAGSTDVVIQLATLGLPYRVDQFKGMVATIDGEERIVVQSGPSSITLNKALSAAPSAAEPVAIAAKEYVGGLHPRVRTHPGSHFDGARLAMLIQQIVAGVTNYTLPT